MTCTVRTARSQLNASKQQQKGHSWFCIIKIKQARLICKSERFATRFKSDAPNNRRKGIKVICGLTQTLHHQHTDPPEQRAANYCKWKQTIQPSSVLRHQLPPPTDHKSPSRTRRELLCWMDISAKALCALLPDDSKGRVQIDTASHPCLGNCVLVSVCVCVMEGVGVVVVVGGVAVSVWTRELFIIVWHTD